MKDYLKLQAVLFGVFDERERISERIEDLIKELDMDTFVKKSNCHPDFSQRDQINLFGANSGYDINITNNRIDINSSVLVNSMDNTIKGIELETFIKYAKVIFKTILSHFDTQGNRISLVTSKLFSENAESIIKKNISENAYKKDEVFEWATRATVREEIELNGTKEMLNIVTNLSNSIGKIEIQGVMIGLTGMLVNFDINTIPETKVMRIDDGFIECFYSNMITYVRKLEEHFTHVQ